MPDQDSRSVLVALGKGRGKPRSPTLPNVNDCGDIGLRIARDGTWSYRGSPIGRKPLVKLFASVLRREADGRYFLVTPVEKVGIEVEDAPFLAVAMTVEGAGKEQRLSFLTNLDDVVVADPAHSLSFRVEQDRSFTPFVEVRDGLRARLTRAVYYELVAVAVGDGDAERREFGVWSGGTFFPFPVSPVSEPEA
jgi:hypothetical protein